MPSPPGLSYGVRMKLPHLWRRSTEHFWYRCIEPLCQMVVLDEDLHRRGITKPPSNKTLNRLARRWHW